MVIIVKLILISGRFLEQSFNLAFLILLLIIKTSLFFGFVMTHHFMTLLRMSLISVRMSSIWPLIALPDSSPLICATSSLWRNGHIDSHILYLSFDSGGRHRPSQTLLDVFCVLLVQPYLDLKHSIGCHVFSTISPLLLPLFLKFAQDRHKFSWIGILLSTHITWSIIHWTATIITTCSTTFEDWLSPFFQRTIIVWHLTTLLNLCRLLM